MVRISEQGTNLFGLPSSKGKKAETKRYKIKKVRIDCDGAYIVAWDGRHPLFITLGVLATAIAMFGPAAILAVLVREGYENLEGTIGWIIGVGSAAVGAFFTSGHYAVLEFNDLWVTTRRERFNLGFSRRYLTRRVRSIHYWEDSAQTQVAPQRYTLSKKKTAALVLCVDGDTHLLMQGIDKETAREILEAVWQRYPEFRPPLPSS